VEGIKHVYALAPESEPEEADTESPRDATGQSALRSSNLSDLRPMISQVLYYWRWFVEAIDPLLKVVHQPTIEQSINALVSNQMRDITMRWKSCCLPYIFQSL
jgi:hypothetical protein